MANEIEVNEKLNLQLRRCGLSPKTLFISSLKDHIIQKKLIDISKDIYDKWQLDDVAYLHRIGRVDIGEISLIVGVAAPHRKEAFLACQYSVDLIKKIVPIWKKEVYVDGEVWIGTPEDTAMRNF